MAITISGENNNDKILASDGVIDSLSSLNIAGIATATTFVGNLTGNVTGDVGGNLTGNVTGNINNTTLLLQTGGYERVRIASDGVITGRGELRLTQGNSTVSNGSEIGSLMYTYPSNDNKNAKIVALSNGGSSGADLAFFTRTQGDAFNTDGGTEKLRITSAGKVGIGTDAGYGDAKLTVEGTAALTNNDTTLQIKDSVNDSAAGRGGNIGFSGYVNGTQRTFAGIGGLKSSAGAGGFDGDLALYTRRNGQAELDERLRISSSGHVMIGTTTEGFATYGDQFTIANTGHCGMTIRSGTSSYGTIYFSDADDGSADEVRGFIDYNHSTNQLQLGSNAATRLRINSDGYVTKPTNFCLQYTPSGSIDLASGTVIYATEVFDVGDSNAYDTSTGEFTAPITGIYRIHYEHFANNGRATTNIEKDTGSGYSVLKIGMRVYSQAAGANWSSVPTIYYAQLNSGDKIKITVREGTVHINSPWNHLTIQLVQ